MAEYRTTIIRENDSVAVSDRDLIDLPTDPMSYLLLTVRCVNLTAALMATLRNVLDAITLLNLTFKGASIFTGNGRDAMVYAAMHDWDVPLMNNWDDAAGQVLYAAIPIPLGRRPFWREECFPATNKGDLQLAIEWAAAFTAITTVSFTLHAVELPGATPERFLKAVRKTRTASATGESRVDLPIGNMLAGVLIFSTTVPVGGAVTTTVDKLELLADNVERYVPAMNWQALQAHLARRIPRAYEVSGHKHTENLAAAYLQNALTDVGVANSHINNYGLLDLDPLRDGLYLFDTNGLGQLDLNVTFGDLLEMRYFPLELVRAPTARP